LNPFALTFLLSFPLVWKNVSIFKKEQIKEKTFICSIRNFVIMNSAYLLSILIAAIGGYLFFN
ncbi:MAG: prenyltransferase, partial [Lachnospiraceae bacterium]|nr:prenyltransferase [Lachnospiraceae bacterium]